MRRRYEAWFIKMMLADGSGAWWFRYLLLNPGRKGGGGCPNNPLGRPAQVWATWFPTEGAPQSFIQGYPREELSMSEPGAEPFRLEIAGNRIVEDSCAGRLEVDGHTIAWELKYSSTFRATMSNVGWIGFSRTPHSDAFFSGGVALDGREVGGKAFGYGLQGHNCGYRHRNSWNWTHCLASTPSGGVTTFEALEYEIVLGLRFRKAILWHGGLIFTFKRFTNVSRDRANMKWRFTCVDSDEQAELEVEIDGGGPSLHRLPYLKTDCSATFEVSNNCLSKAVLYFTRRGHAREEIKINRGAVLEMTGD